MDTLTLADLHAVELAPRRLMSVTVFQVGNTIFAKNVTQGSTVTVNTIGGPALVSANNSLNVGNLIVIER